MHVIELIHKLEECCDPDGTVQIDVITSNDSGLTIVPTGVATMDGYNAIIVCDSSDRGPYIGGTFS